VDEIFYASFFTPSATVQGLIAKLKHVSPQK